MAKVLRQALNPATGRQPIPQKAARSLAVEIDPAPRFGNPLGNNKNPGMRLT
ncbi:hypothetical protein N0M98_12175 [Paenibacillus doosanensis]|uniref:hypothetical protein n=1 Tax=Paenibacillus doosanensis TaxID=1229154 RepID=UPI00217FBF0E|nr:hypothetical protein [Paenibacillus doosanensis]MCS7460900.1 hypothetical protein [Paenibacillus doosanensis]